MSTNRIRFIEFRGQPQIRAGISTRHGGASTGPFSSFNLGRSAGEDLSIVSLNRERYADEFGVDPAHMVFGWQCHGDSIAETDAGCEIDQTDGFMTNTPGILLNVSVADCFPVWFADAETGWIAVNHCGWRGVVAGIHRKQIQKFDEKGSSLKQLQIIIGPGIRSCHFEVRADIVENFPSYAVKPGPSPGTWLVDLPAMLIQDFLAAGLLPEQISDIDECTFCLQSDYYSYRRDGGITGRMMAGIVKSR